jgi:4-hydroxy-tetrahydrodipicolinate synthase
MFSGSMVALVTPMKSDGSIDYTALTELVEWHIAAGTTALIIAGTTGESATLDMNEKAQLLSHVIKQVRKRIQIIAGTGTNSTTSTLKLSTNAKKTGADACLIVTPYYNKPPQAGLIAHYKSIADEIDLPIILYNVPSRTACDLLPETVEQLSTIKHIIGIKEATGKIERAEEILNRCRKGFEVYSGDDATALALMTKGARGVISVTANVAPEKMQQLCQAVSQKNLDLAEKINHELDLLHHRLFVEANPIPVKWALNQMNKIGTGIRLPLLALDKRYHNEVKEAMQMAGVI